MKRWSKFWLLVALGGLILAAAAPAQAECSAWGPVVYSYYSPGGNPAYAYFYISNSVYRGGYVTYFKTSDPQIAKMLSAAQAVGIRVDVYGDATACPGSGTVRYGGVLKSCSISYD